jgi:drug/metabolite transporter (DMT)-like permease
VGQRAVGAEQAALVYALDPVWGALFAHYLLGKKKTQQQRGYPRAAT